VGLFPDLVWLRLEGWAHAPALQALSLLP